MPILIAMFLWAAGSLIARMSATLHFIGRTVDRRRGRSARFATRLFRKLSKVDHSVGGGRNPRNIGPE